MQVIELDYHRYDPLTVAAAYIHRPASILLDSAAGGGNGRYSFFAADPFAVLSSKGSLIRTTTAAGIEEGPGNPWAAIKAFWQRYQCDAIPELPPLQGGLAGFWSYDLARQLERLPAPRRDDLLLPDLWLGAYDWTLAWDHQRKACWLVATGLPAATPRGRRRGAEARVREALARLAAVPAAAELPTLAEPAGPAPAGWYAMPDWPGVHSTFSPEAYVAAVERALGYLRAGDSYQINLSQRLDAPLRRHPWVLYNALRRRNPADFAAYLRCDDLYLLSASPERFLRLDRDQVETRPIKGTVARGADPADDARRAAALLASAKNRAENVMIVDLLRNDLSRVCRAGSVEVPEVWALERHPTVYHLVSTVTGRLRREVEPPDLLPACFPGGSITGAPKIRTMEIIAELEPTARGPYCGAIGYLSWSGQIDTSIVIRTMVACHGRVFWQVGGGIVADSQPDDEYAETLLKAKALSETILATW